MKFKELMKKVFSTKKGKAVFSVVIAAVIGISIGITAIGVTVHNKNKVEQARLEEVEKAKEVQAEVDSNAAKETDELIEKIGTVTLNSNGDITHAETSYKKLSANAKKLVEHYDDLKKARADYDKLLLAKETEDASSGAVNTSSGTEEVADTATDTSKDTTVAKTDTSSDKAAVKKAAAKKSAASTASTQTPASTNTTTAVTGTDATTPTVTTSTDTAAAPAAPAPDTPANTDPAPSATPTESTETASTGTTLPSNVSSVVDNGDGTTTTTSSVGFGTSNAVTTDNTTGEVISVVSTVNGITFYPQN